MAWGTCAKKIPLKISCGRITALVPDAKPRNYLDASPHTPHEGSCATGVGLKYQYLVLQIALPSAPNCSHFTHTLSALHKGVDGVMLFCSQVQGKAVRQ
jgi:hypothetical protein